MAAKDRDPTQPIRLKAASYANVDEGTACTQSSFKTGNKAFLFIGKQGGRFKAMFKLTTSKPEAEKLSGEAPDRFDVGSSVWVTARFTAQEPMPARLWRKWLEESYRNSVGGGNATGKKQTVKKQPAKKKTAKKKTAKKPTVKKKR